MKTLRLPFFAFLLSALYSCSSDPGETKVSEDQPKDKDLLEFTVEAGTTYLQGAYVTSMATPFSDNAIANMFDNDSATAWTTMKGSGPDEGCMLYFDKETFVKEIQIAQPTGSQFASIKTVTVYGNGKNLGDFDASKPIAVGKEISSLFIKVKETDAEKTERYSPEEEVDEEITSFSAEKSVGIARLTIIGENGELKLQPPVSVIAGVSASTTLEPEAAYNVGNLFDSRREMGWAEGNTETSGENETITLKFNKKVNLTGIEIWNGFQRSEKHFSANARVKSLTVEAIGGEGKASTLELPDSATPILLKLTESLLAKEFRITVKEVYPGEKYKDLVISEIRLYSGDVPFVVTLSDEEKRIAATKTAVNGTVMEDFLDRKISYSVSYGFNSYYSASRSVSFRSNNTFVMYTQTYNDDQSVKDTLEIVADGNWELIQANATTAKVKVFGKYQNLTDDYGFYKGRGEAAYEKIFSDIVTINNTSIQGEKFIEKIFLKAGKNEYPY